MSKGSNKKGFLAQRIREHVEVLALINKLYYLFIILFWILLGIVSFSLRQSSRLIDVASLASANAGLLSQALLTSHVYSPPNTSGKKNVFDKSFINHLTPQQSNLATLSLQKVGFRVITDFPSNNFPSSTEERELLRNPYSSGGLLKINQKDSPASAEHLTSVVTTSTCIKCHSGDPKFIMGKTQMGIVTILEIEDIIADYRERRRGDIVADVFIFSFLTLISIFVMHLLFLFQTRSKMDTSKIIEREKMASLGLMVAGFSHELGTPIGVAVSANSQIFELASNFETLLRQDEVSEDEISKPLSLLKESSQLVSSHLDRAYKMIKQFKSTAVNLSTNDNSIIIFKDIFEDIVVDMRHLHKNSNITIDISYPPELCTFGSISALKQVLYNLYSNAIKYGFSEGTSPGLITIDCFLEEGEIKIYFIDNGRGMDEETARHIFEPFFTTNRSKGGMGLGMFIVYELITINLSGTVRCTSILGQGTQFEITIPYTPPPLELNE
ncbi:MAG: HAMP domain-containing histidine kinase [Holophagaceae bacterium]|nr:HAMP domain-containing histidine kinase [Holophagaceae bacterium]